MEHNRITTERHYRRNLLKRLELSSLREWNESSEEQDCDVAFIENPIHEKQKGALELEKVLRAKLALKTATANTLDTLRQSRGEIYRVVPQSEYEQLMKLSDRVEALESSVGIQRRYMNEEAGFLSPDMVAVVLYNSYQVFGGPATISQSDEGGLIVRVTMRADSPVSERVDSIEKWLATLRNVSPQLAEGLVRLELDFE